MANESWCGKWALVTGANSGIGAALAEELAAGGANLVLTARRARRLANLRTRLRASHGVLIKVLAADLAQPNTPAEIFPFTQERGIAVDLLVSNAGVGSYGEFRASDLERELGIIHVNCSAMVQLTHLYLPGMVERRSGAILIVSSTAAYQGVPYMATYAASKGFDLLFAEALAREVEHYGVRVCALCPGPTSSEFQKVAGVPDDLSMGLEPADRVAREGLRALAPENTRSSRDSRTGWEWKSSEWFPGGWSSQRPKCCSIPAANLGRRARNRTAAVRWTC